MEKITLDVYERLVFKNELKLRGVKIKDEEEIKIDEEIKEEENNEILEGVVV